ncbi:MAG TPA: hypothetical protein VEY51_16330 [Chondromyces sp.]|nr:hypothetical protein [Chondromyces sp.]
MVETLLNFMLGPFRGISQFYFENQMIFNTLIVGIAVYKVMINKKRDSRKETTN